VGLTGSANGCSLLFVKKLGNCLECQGIVSLLSGSSARKGMEVQVPLPGIVRNVRKGITYLPSIVADSPPTPNLLIRYGGISHESTKTVHTSQKAPARGLVLQASRRKDSAFNSQTDRVQSSKLWAAGEDLRTYGT
jgi:hypothetical protein